MRWARFDRLRSAGALEPFRFWWLHIAALWALAVAQPLLDLIARNSDFLVAHQMNQAGVFGLTAVLVVLCPLLLIATIAGIRLVQRTASAVAVVVAVGILTALLAMQVGKRVSTHASLVIPAACILGVLCAVAYHRSSVVRAMGSTLSIAIVAVPLVFWLQPGVLPIVSARSGMSIFSGVQASASSDTPVVFVVFDEISLVSLLDAEAMIDPALFPNLADLASAGVWFRNATTVCDYTRWALPAIVTGRHPNPDAAPSGRDHPQSIFSLLAPTHEVVAIESVTDLCPDTVCARSEVPLGSRVTRLGRDLVVLFQHIVLTDDLTRRLPDLTTAWADFQAPEAANPRAAAARRAELRRLKGARPSRDSRMERINVLSQRIQQRDAGRSQLYFLHSMLSHTPHWLLPSGQIDSTRSATTALQWPTALPGKTPEPWSRDEWVVAQAYQRHLLQIGFVDAVVGRIISDLKAAQIYDRSLVIVLSDHGTAFRPGWPRRDLIPENAAEVMRIPLIVKLPAGSPVAVPGTYRRGAQNVNDRNVETIDLVPTIADVLGIRLPWPTDGRSLVDPAGKEPAVKTIFYDMARRRQDFDRAGPDLRPALRAKLEIFGGAENPYRVPKPARFGELVGQTAGDVPIVDGGCAVTVDYLSDFSRMDPDADRVPFEFGGQLDEGGLSNRLPYLAVSVNGTIRAVTRPWQNAPREWIATPPLDAWRSGANDVGVFRVDPAPSGLVLRRCTVREGRSHARQG